MKGNPAKYSADVLEQVCHRHIGDLYTLCRRYLDNDDDAQDALQNAFLRIVKSIDRFQDRGEGSMRAWMSRIAANESVRLLKSKGRLRRMERTDSLPDIPEDASADFGGIDDATLYDMIGELPEGARTVLNLFVFEKWSHKEIAAALHISESTSASQFHYAKKLLAEKLKKKSEE